MEQFYSCSKHSRRSFAFSCRPFRLDLYPSLTTGCVVAKTAPLPVLAFARSSLQNFYLPSTRSIPEKSNSNLGRGSLPTRSVSCDWSREITCETLATESFGSPVTRADKLTLPGASAHFRLLVSGTQTTVEIRLWLSASP